MVFSTHCWTNETSFFGTGLHSSGAYANIIIDDLYTTVINKSSMNPIGNGNYVDDAVVIWPHIRQTLQKFKEDSNSVWDSVNFELEIDEGDGIPFLDMLLRKAADGSVNIHSIRNLRNFYTSHRTTVHQE